MSSGKKEESKFETPAKDSEEVNTPSIRRNWKKGILKKSKLNNSVGSFYMETFKMTQNRKVVSLTPAKHLSNNKLKIQTSKFGLGLKHKESTNSATLPNQGMNLQSFRKIRRMSTLGLHQFNKR